MFRWILFLCVAVPRICLADDKPPQAPVHEVQDDYFGTKISDPYRWMENIKHDPEAQKWLKAQADFTRQKFDAMPGYNRLKARIAELMNSEPATIEGPQVMANGNIFYLKTAANQNTAKLCYKATASAAEVILVDPDDYQKREGKPFAINYYVPSWDGSHVLFGISAQGSENAAIHVVETATRKETGDVIPRCEFSAVSWFADGKRFLYSQLQELKPGQSESEKYYNIKTRVHELGAPPDGDKTLLTTNSNPSVLLKPEQFGWIQIVRGSKICVAYVTNFVANEIACYTTDLKSLSPGSHWTKLCDFADEVTGLAEDEKQFYFLNHKDAPRFKIDAATWRDGKLADWHTVVPESEKVVQGLTCSKDGLYYTASDGVDCRVYKLGPSGSPSEIALPYQGWASVTDSEEPPTDDLQRSGVLVTLTSWTRAVEFYRYDPDAQKIAELPLRPPGPYDSPPDLISEEIKVPSYDGTKVPMSILGRKDFRKDGTHPARLVGYGAYGITDEPHYSPQVLALLDHGFWVVTAHVRGGGVYGDAWHKAGMKATKPNTWKDFIACGDYLIKEGYAAKDKLAGIGGSAGGITIGRAVTERPDLFAVGISLAGALDSLRAETTPNGPPNIPEFGTVTEKAGFEALLAMSTYANIKPGTAYPAILLYCGYNDPRVDVWESAKTAARFQAATSGNNPVLLDVDYESGHGIGNTREQDVLRSTDIVAFMLWQFGDPEFQPGHEHAGDRLEGTLRTGVVAIGGETAGTTLEMSDGSAYELDFDNHAELRENASRLNGSKVVVSGKQVTSEGVEVKRRQIIEVQEPREEK
jgi:prolyl oligopeptidase